MDWQYRIYLAIDALSWDVPDENFPEALLAQTQGIGGAISG